MRERFTAAEAVEAFGVSRATYCEWRRRLRASGLKGWFHEAAGRGRTAAGGGRRRRVHGRVRVWVPGAQAAAAGAAATLAGRHFGFCFADVPIALRRLQFSARNHPIHIDDTYRAC